MSNEQVYEVIHDIFMTYTNQALDDEGNATYTMDDEDRIDFYEALTGNLSINTTPVEE